MKAPVFWSADKPTAWAKVLAPLGRLYAGATARRVAKPPHVTPALPVLCVGNLTAGGTGKTPTVVHIIKAAQGMGLKPHVLSRGYGGAEKGPLQVDLMKHSAADVGDEPLMLAAFAPVTVAANRAAGATAIATAGNADFIIMDDGFQNPDIGKTASVLVFDGGVGIGNGLSIPAGALREDFAAGLARADAALIIGEDKTGLEKKIKAHSPMPVFHGTLAPGPETAWLKGQRVTAFAGIGRPEKFFETLQGLGAQLAGTFPFPDHHPYKGQDFMLIDRHCAKTGSIAVTTEKDAVRLPRSRMGRVAIVRVDLGVEDDPSFAHLIFDRLNLPSD